MAINVRGRNVFPLPSKALRYAAGTLAGVASVWLRILFIPVLGSSNPYHTAWAAVVFSAWYCGPGPALITLLVALVGVNYWLSPLHSFDAHNVPEVAGAIGFVVLSALIILIGKAHRRASDKQRAADVEGRRARMLFETFMDNSPATTYLKDEGGRFVYTNRTNQARLGVASIAGKTDLDLFSPQLAAIYRAQDRVVLETNRAHEFTDSTLEGDGERTWLTIKFPVLDSEGCSFVGAMSFDISDRKRMEDDLRTARDQQEEHVRARTRELHVANENLRQLSMRLLRMQDEERRRIARELHDSVGQMLVALCLNLSSLESESHKLSPGGAKALFDHGTLLQETVKEVRTVSHLLHPPLLDEAGLSSAITWYVEGFSERSGIAVDLDISKEFTRLPDDMEIAIFRIVQECLTNIVRHSQSKTAGIRVLQRQGVVVLEVRDAGQGIRPDKLFTDKDIKLGGVGLRGVKERAAEFGGKLGIQSNSSGTVIFVTMPLPEIADPQQQS